MNPTQRYKTLRDQKRSRDVTLAELRQLGASPFECIVAAREIDGVGLADAKRIVAASPSWADCVRQNDEALIRELETWDTEEPK